MLAKLIIACTFTKFISLIHLKMDQVPLEKQCSGIICRLNKNKIFIFQHKSFESCIFPDITPFGSCWMRPIGTLVSMTLRPIGTPVSMTLQDPSVLATVQLSKVILCRKTQLLSAHSGTNTGHSVPEYVETTILLQ